ncbi:hypothetical protein [Streptomyces mirabilis]|uniref:hypothetical protein n=1 Tax=Streptomyces mirabilis TaxID=68239 RepID=UPI0036A1C636
MNRPTNRIQKLQQHQLLGFFARRGLRAAALGPLGGAWEVGPWRAQLGCVLLAPFLTFYSLG